ncbi:uncharacterized protein THITE_2141300 [Thermothielavioides terrestris NRRL 8126]|uniref:CENP-V/GFA domain-containing protein n=1 Tax=Thermothielavioides terrestris (strain ATCC 38088 / NRRL 8126) TaxID=578455 RepID=G2QXC7_THETT|nr:uncharacterized protein THITE_2141300 [Thermothielavioides terrestris NRRL 8126]AEO63150.1 hypothetical protein THITE_2141300 [Thermothielavioides terrestris NRRL 8126]
MTTPADNTTVTLQAQCLCRAHTFTATVPVSALPLRGSSCHCTSCRHVTGALRTSSAAWPGDAAAIVRAAAAGSAKDAAGNDDGGVPLRRYRRSPRLNVLFCGRCGSKLFFEEFEAPAAAAAAATANPAGYRVFTGVLSVLGEVQTQTQLRVVRCEDHIYVGDTGDGGAAAWLRGINGEDGPCARVWLGGRGESEEVPPGKWWPAVGELLSPEVTLKAAEGDRGNVPFRCHCGGVQFVLRAGEAQRDWEERQRRGEELPVWIDPVTHKALVVMDCCDSCRIWNGAEVLNWTFALVEHISFAGPGADGFSKTTPELKQAFEANDGRLGTLAMYASSPEVQRYFCSKCSACVFFAINSRPEMVDIGLGLLDSPDGARAERVTSWALGGRLTWQKDFEGTWREGLLHAISRDSELWRIERGYPKNWVRAAREKAAEAGGK